MGAKIIGAVKITDDVAVASSAVGVKDALGTNITWQAYNQKR